MVGAFCIVLTYRMAFGKMAIRELEKFLFPLLVFPYEGLVSLHITSVSVVSIHFSAS